MQLTLTHSGVFYLVDGCTQLLQRIVKSTGAHSCLVDVSSLFLPRARARGKGRVSTEKEQIRIEPEGEIDAIADLQRGRKLSAQTVDIVMNEYGKSLLTE